MASGHTDQEFEQELRSLREQTLVMGRAVEQMISRSMSALVRRDAALARDTIESDHRINRLEIGIDELCLRILALRQPVGSDLRLIAATLKIVTDLERIGDQCVNICERAAELSSSEPVSTGPELVEMADLSREMVREALEAFLAPDSARAEDVIAKDRKVDAMYAEIFRAELDRMQLDPGSVYGSHRLQAVAKHLERIADHATNVAEMTVFLVRGQDVRHTGKLDERTPPRGVLFLCVANSARSQMAEGWARKLFPPEIPVWSAGSHPAAMVHPAAVEVMREVGIDISTAAPKRISDVPLEKVDAVITLCEEEVCLPLPGERLRETWSLPDPVKERGDATEVLAAFRRIRDEIQSGVLRLAGAWR